MDLALALMALGLEAADPVALRLHRELTEDLPAAPGDWRGLAAAVTRALMPLRNGSAPRWRTWNRNERPTVVGIAGGQGSGKTTLARVLQRGLELAGANAAACSIDDFYLSRAERVVLAESVHPLLATRGVPGTHDAALLADVIDALGGTGPVAMPVFDKGADDRLPKETWRQLEAPVDVLVLEGWCIGARPQPEADLRRPVNALEAGADPTGEWRHYVNAALAGPYADLWRRLDLLVYLQVPDLDAVLRWRTEQEQALPSERRMDQAALARFVAHYERITRWMLADLPGRASLVARLDGDHRVAELRRNPAR